MKPTVCFALLTLPLSAASATLGTPAQSNAAPVQTAPAVFAKQPAQTSANVTDQAQKPSSLIAPAVDHLSQVVSQVQLERWKAPSRDETDTNLRSVERNISTTLPTLVTAADAQPNSVAASLPVLRNLDALCAVMIRVSVTARSNAPAPQAESLNGALSALQSARNTLADQVQTLATAQEKQINSLTTTVATLTAKVNTPPPPPTATPATKPRPKKKAAPKPAQPPKSPPQ